MKTNHLLRWLPIEKGILRIRQKDFGSRLFQRPIIQSTWSDMIIYSWWLNQPNWKIWVKMDHFPNFRGENKKYLKPPPSHLRDPSNSAGFVTFLGWKRDPSYGFSNWEIGQVTAWNGIFTQQWMAKIYCKLVGTRWFKPWPFHPLFRGHQQPFKGSRFHHPKKITSRIARYTWSFKGVPIEP